MAETIQGTAAWKGSDIVDDPRWQFSLQDADLAEIDAALQHGRKLKLDPRSIRSDHFPLDRVKTKLARIASEHVPGAPQVSPEQWQGLDVLAMLAEEQHFEMVLAAGDIQFVNNHVIYHSRTAFEDDADAGKQRCLWRIWLSAPHRALPPAHAVLWREVESGKVRGGIGVDPVS